MSLRVGSLLRPLLGHSASCCSAGVTTPPAAPPVTCCSAGVTTPPAGTRISVPSAGLSIFVLPAALPTTTASTNNFIGVASPFQQSLSPPWRPSTFNNRSRRFCGRDCVLCRSRVLLPGPQSVSLLTTSLYTLPSTIAFAAFAALYLQQSLWPLLRPRLCPFFVGPECCCRVPKPPAGLPASTLYLQQSLSPLPMPILLGRSSEEHWPGQRWQLASPLLHSFKAGQFRQFQCPCGSGRHSARCWIGSLLRQLFQCCAGVATPPAGRSRSFGRDNSVSLLLGGSRSALPRLFSCPVQLFHCFLAAAPPR